MTPACLVSTGVPPEAAAPLLAAASRWQIDTPLRLAHWLAQLGAESSFVPQTENLNYTSPERICQVWPSRFPRLADALPYVRNPAALANKVYAERMGNGSTASGDGWRYRGRGFIQNTGKGQYAALSEALGVDLLHDPDGLLELLVAAHAAGWYWHSRGINKHADTDDLEAVTRAVNGGLNGLGRRREWLGKLRAALADCGDPVEPGRLLIVLGQSNAEVFRLPLGPDDHVITRAAGDRYYVRIETPQT